jgi:hypothetical protein
MRRLAFVLVVLALPVAADQPALRPSAGLLLKYPDLLQAGSCVVYREGGGGSVLTEPLFFVKGKVLGTAITTRQLRQCPLVPGKPIEQYKRDEFVRHVQAIPCLAPGAIDRDEQIGMVRLSVSEWDTPHMRKAENAGRLYRGMFLDRLLEKGMEIELEADLLSACNQNRN